MRRLTIKQRAQRATNRINKLVAVKYPLLAEQLSTTIAEQEQRIAQKDADFQTHWGKLQEFDEAISEFGIDRREAVRSVVSVEIFAELEQKYNRIYNGRIRSGAGYADYWWQAVKRYNPAWGQGHCPNQVLHSRAYSKCPTCGKSLKVTIDPQSDRRVAVAVQDATE